MNKTAIKNFAIWARVNLIESAKQRAYEYEITDGGENNPNAEIVGGRPLSRNEQNQRKQLIEQIRIKGFDQVMEEAAYTWFNRFIALRYMEVNGYLPTRIRVFTNEEGEFKPEILKEAMTVELDGLDREKVFELLDKQDNESLYKMLLIAQCNSLNAGLPYMFENIANWTELLFPANLLKSDSVIGQMISAIPEEDWTDAVQVIGWMYQYYISEKHNQVININKGIVKKADIPAATQLFTTDWVVRYMVDNSLGRYWIERNPNSHLAEKLAFFVSPQNGEIGFIDEQVKPEDITFFDPCMGSGHILVYAFDVLMEIYRECGYSDRDAAKSILENNLYGLDIDDRCSQLANFALLMKARGFNRRVLTTGILPNAVALQESDCISDEIITFVANNDSALKADLIVLRKAFGDAKEIGSLISLPKIGFEELYRRLNEIRDSYPDNLFSMQCRSIVIEKLAPLIKQAEIISQKYSIVCTNPPYMNKYEGQLKTFLAENYKEYSGDLFSVFMVRNFDYCMCDGYSAFMTPFTWMFIKTYEKLRNYIISEKALTSLIQFEYSAFEEATVPICSFILKNGKPKNKALCFRLSDFKGGMDIQKEKVCYALANKNCGYFYEASQENFLKIPGCPISYWVGKRLGEIFQTSSNIGKLADVRIGMGTGNNDLFLREWWEVSNTSIGFGVPNVEEADSSKKKYFPYGKGGDCRRWYGNQDKVVWYDKSGRQEMAKTSGHRENGGATRYFQESLTWSYNTSAAFNARYMPTGFVFDVNGSSIFAPEEYRNYILAFLTSAVCRFILGITNATITTQAGNIRDLPIIFSQNDNVNILAEECIEFEKAEWDDFETSWNFIVHPFIRWEKSLWDCTAIDATMSHYYGASKPKEVISPIELCYLLWQGECRERFEQLKANEEELNRIFIDIYGLQDELTPEVDDKDVTVRLADKTRDVKSFISYAVGCMFGRYSVDVEGVAYAGGEWDESKYSSFIPDADSIIPICDDEYFEDDIIGRFIKFVETVYGASTLEENLKFIADALGGSGTPREVIRKYFMSDFYTDHLKNYQKRPIYWQFDSGKKNGFKCLIYMHRYQPDTIARIRTDYIHELQSRYRTAIADLEDRVERAAASERVKLSKQLAKIKDQELELRKYEEKIHHLADQMIEIDLDDGVKVNYAKFGDVLAKIK